MRAARAVRHVGKLGGPRLITFMSGDDDHAAADNCERLSAVNAVYAADDSFHVNQNIAPANGS